MSNTGPFAEKAPCALQRRAQPAPPRLKSGHCLEANLRQTCDILARPQVVKGKISICEIFFCCLENFFPDPQNTKEPLRILFDQPPATVSHTFRSHFLCDRKGRSRKTGFSAPPAARLPASCGQKYFPSYKTRTAPASICRGRSFGELTNLDSKALSSCVSHAC